MMALIKQARGHPLDPWKIGGYALVIVFVVWAVLPIAVIVLNSFKSTVSIFSSTPHLLFSPTLHNYRDAFSEADYARLLANSSIVATGTMALALGVGVPAAYALAKLPMRGREGWALGILFTRMVPAVVLVVPIYVIFVKTHLIGSYWAMTLADTTFNLPLVIWLMRSFFAEVPEELESAAQIDGCSPAGVFRRVALPLSLPGLVATAILCLIFSWNEYLFALTLSSQSTQTVPVGVAGFVGTVAVDWGGSSAAAVIALLPIFILALFAQRFLVRGLTMGAVKG
jgi:multiple sugar transport system permease protein